MMGCFRGRQGDSDDETTASCLHVQLRQAEWNTRVGSVEIRLCAVSVLCCNRDSLACAELYHPVESEREQRGQSKLWAACAGTRRKSLWDDGEGRQQY